MNQVISNPYLNVKQVSAKVGISIATIYRWMKAGKFPQAISLGTNTVRWPMADIEAWLDAKASA